ncbi:MBL fold metallo-hydrolase [Nocardia sp. NPDC101769]|uniref:MBL fold metallo-hydrolase n=1 Tax=Nocardia sp. NPDC101769 TaxID=3364333 RepID=UPI0037F5E11C
MKLGIEIHALGGPTAVVSIGGLRLLTDPTFDGPGKYRLGAGRELVKTAAAALSPQQVGPVDAVLLSHDQHPDNLDTAGRRYLAQVPLVLTTAAAEARLAGSCRAVGVWEHVDLVRPDGGTLRITRVPAQHGPDGTEHLVGEVAGFVLTGADLPTVYISGDNASLDVVRAVAERFPTIDVAMLFAGAASTALIEHGHLTLTSAEAATAARILGAWQVVPLHFDSWQHFTEGAAALLAAFTDAGLRDRLTLLRPGDHTAVVLDSV